MELLDLMSPLHVAERFCEPEGSYKRARHLELIQAECLQTLFGDWDVCVIMAPPRHGKSEYVSRWLLAWLHSVYVYSPTLITSYSLDLARDHSRWVRNQVHRLKDVFGHVGVDPDVSAASDWKMLGSPYGMKAAGVGGGITGRGGKYIVIDDPIKNAEQAISQRMREAQWEWFQTTLLTRMEPKAKLFCVGTRWHRDDLLGKILQTAESKKLDGSSAGLRIRELRLPALAEPTEAMPDPLGRQTDEPLWPERISYDALCRIRDTTDDYWWSAVYQQRLGTHGKNEWPESYFYGIFAQDDEWPERLVLLATALDPSKGRDAKSGDYQAIVAAGYSSGYIWVDCHMDRQPVPEMIDKLVDINFTLRPTVCGIESVAFQELLAESYVAAARERGYYDDPVLLDNRVNKNLRIARLGFWLRLHRIKIRNNAGGRLLVEQMREFPNGQHDDGCFAVGTLIAMADGTEKPIEHVQAGEMVRTRHGDREVRLAGRTGVRPVTAYGYGDGTSLVATSSHPVCSQGQFMPIREAKEVESSEGRMLRRVSEMRIGIIPVYNLTVDGGEYLANGVVVHNCDALEMAVRLLLMVCEDLQEVNRMQDEVTQRILV